MRSSKSHCVVLPHAEISDHRIPNFPRRSIQPQTLKLDRLLHRRKDIPCEHDGTALMEKNSVAWDATICPMWKARRSVSREKAMASGKLIDCSHRQHLERLQRRDHLVMFAAHASSSFPHFCIHICMTGSDTLIPSLVFPRVKGVRDWSRTYSLAMLSG